MKTKLFVILFIMLASVCFAQEWYVGGTLHNASGLEWQEATYENKLATCGDFVSKMWQDKSFKLEIQQRLKTMDDVKVLSVELVRVIDGTFEKDPDPEVNKKAFANQKVSSAAVMLMMMMGWLES